MPRYVVICPVCNTPFPAYERYVDHVFKDHTDQLALRMKYKIVRS